MVTATDDPRRNIADAIIRNLDNPKEFIKCMFCPNEYTVNKSNSWTKKTKKGKSTPELEFSGGQPTTLNMELLFDTYETGEDVRRKYTNFIWRLMEINPKTIHPKTHKGRPYICAFEWGYKGSKAWSFEAVITNIQQKFTLFKGDGTPLRATLNVTFELIKDTGFFPPQNPTTGGGSGYRTRVVREGETIDWIAHDEYGDSALWRLLADANNLEDPIRLAPGQVLSIAPLS